MFDPSSAFEEKTIEREPRPKKNWKEWFLNLLQNVSGTVIGFGLLVFLSTLPLIFNFGDAKWYAKILMLLGSLYALLFLLILPATFTEATKSNKWLLFFSPLFAFFILGIISYFNFELWGHKSLALGLVFTWTIFVGLYLSIKALFNKTLGSENTPIVLIAMAILTLFIAVVNEKTSNNLSADLYYKISVGIVYLIAIALYANRYIYKQKNEHKVISNIIGIIFWGAIITISFPFYIQWCGLTGDDFNTFVSVYAAVLGGGITLAGVAWTIKDANEDKKKDLILQNKPIMYAHMMNKLVTLKETPIELLFVNFKAIKSIGVAEESDSSSNLEPQSSEEQAPIKTGGTVILKSIVNTDNSIVIVKKITVNDIELTPLNNNVMAKSKAYNLILNVSELTDKDQIKLYVEDVLKNLYCFTILLYIHKDKKGETQYGIMRIEEYKSEEK